MNSLIFFNYSITPLLSSCYFQKFYIITLEVFALDTVHCVDKKKVMPFPKADLYPSIGKMKDLLDIASPLGCFYGQ